MSNVIKVRLFEPYPENRLFCLDLLRGLDIMFLCCISPLIRDLSKAFGGFPDAVMRQLTHQWEGFLVFDLIMPLFIFMCGAAVPFALGRRLVDGKPTAAYWKHVGARFALLWGLGMLVQGRILTYDPGQFMYFSNTLQTIAIGYVAAAVVLPLKSRLMRLLPAFGALAVYALLMHFGGDYTSRGNLAMKVDKWVFGLFLPDTNPMMKEGLYAWILPSFMYAAMTIFGMESAKLLADKNIKPNIRAAVLTGASLAMLLGGWALSFVIPVIKPVFTVSFTMLAIGWSMLALAALYVLTDIFRFRRGLSVPILFGQFALLAYVSTHVFGGGYFHTASALTRGLEQYLTPEWVKVITRVIMIGLITYVLMIRRAMVRKP